MCSDVSILNIAINFLPLNANIVSINKKNNTGMRGNANDNLIVQYIYNGTDYTLILENNNDYWRVKETYNEFLEIF